MRTPTIVVAADGTEPGRAAVLWAAAEAHRTNLPLTVVHVLDWDWSTSRYDFGGNRFETARRLAEGVAAAAAREAREAVPDITVDTDVLVGNAAAQIIIASEHAELLVLGHRGAGGFAGLRLGSVSQRVAVHAHSPVVVVRGRTGEPTGPIVVGVDDSPHADHVLETAFAVAHQHGTGLVAIRSYLPVRLGHPSTADVRAPDQDEAERAEVIEQLAPWRTKYTDVPVEVLISHDSAAAVLTGVSHGAQLVIVGSRGHGVITGTLLGSTGLQLLHHADCPILIVRPRTKRDRW
ncbi:universal stress protein [Actinoplanes sp. NBRC 101535]|uniref:universal stress protein n=1 Tax=Actinoplanes sp. NBRC 101535 TaxID=3032196 RepID=UPI00249FED77|nr:universal stress protein [Actinoplanes sp. NBRC 101535]GLY08723.1 universal stress protein [Actinoplanes sp. NBRC 101535]